jgi:hypothetical protein
MTEGEGEADRGFVVVDRRASAGARDGEPSAAPEASANAPSAAPEAPREAPAAGPPTGVDFAVLVYSFATSALYHMGFAADPETGRPGERNLPLARQNIEILELIERKTRGNLDADEARLLEGLLYEVRMRFVEASRPPGS